MKGSGTWTCLENCGACCKLSPNEREEAISSLSDKEQEVFLSMVGEDGWCIFYNKWSRKCNVYEQRPTFCNVKNLIKLFNLSSAEFDKFAIKCCKQHIKHIYGSRSLEMKRFVRLTSHNTCYDEKI